MAFGSDPRHDGVMAQQATQTRPSPVLLTEVGLRASERELDEMRAAGVVRIGSVVTVDDADNGAGARYRLIGSDEAGAAGDVAVSSPVGLALLGQRASDTVTASLPNGTTRRLRIVSVAPPY